MEIKITLPNNVVEEYKQEAKKSGVKIEELIEYILSTLLVMSKFDSSEERMEFAEQLDNGEDEGLKVYKEILNEIKIGIN